MTLTLNDTTPHFPAFSIIKSNPRRLLQSDVKPQILISLHINHLQHIFNILREKACFLLRIFVPLHRQSKEQSSCAKSRSSMKTEAGLNRWQAPVINEDHKNGQETAFWGIVIQGTLKRRQSMINKTKLLRGWRYFNIKITCT